MANRTEYFTPEELYAKILSKIKLTTEAYIGRQVVDAVIAVPVSFDDAQRVAVRTAADMAGLDAQRIVNDPVCAGFAHGLDMGHEDKKLLFFGLDDSVLSMSIYEMGEGWFDPIASVNDIRLVEEDCKPDNRLCLAENPTRQDGAGFWNTPSRFILHNPEDTRHALHKTVLQSIDAFLKEANHSKTDIDYLILSGNSSLLPQFQPIAEEYLGLKASDAILPADSVVTGALMLARAIYTPEECCWTPVEVTPVRFGLETMGGIMTPLIPRYKPFPTVVRRNFKTAFANQTSALVKIYQGERFLAKDNFLLGQLELPLPPSAQRLGTIEVVFQLSYDYMLTVTVCEAETGTEVRQDIQLTIPDFYSVTMWDYMILDAEQHSAQDLVLGEFMREVPKSIGGRVLRDSAV